MDVICSAEDSMLLKKREDNLDDSSYGSNIENIGESSMLYKIISDSIHKFIWLHPVGQAIIDTPQFQRLREIKQCGPCIFVYPSATHTRFEHSLGVYHLAGELIEKLIANGTEVSNVNRLCVQLAGLCHDLGHGPYSHTWERFISLATNENQIWKHEKNSIEILENLIEKNNLKGLLMEYGINDKELNLIYDIILGDSDKYENEQYFLFQIIANKETGIDVDKWDYMLRDGLMFNMANELDYKRILSGISTVVCQDGKKRICFRDKLADTILEMFEIRAKMHQKCYQHPVAKRIELMVLDALMAANEFYKYSELTNNVDEFLKLTDYVFHQIKNSTECDPSVCKSKQILERILIRKLYPLLLKVDLRVSQEELYDIAEGLKKSMYDEFSDFSEGFCTAFIVIDFGIRGDPLEKVLFYKKAASDNLEFIHLRKIKTSDISSRFYSYNEREFKRYEILLCCKREFSRVEEEEYLDKLRRKAEEIIYKIAEDKHISIFIYPND